MKKVDHKTESSFREEGSKFISCLFPAETQEVFTQELESIKSTYPDATHHCYAWRLNPAEVMEFAQDDGEPSGTAGLPILNQLKSFEVMNAAIVVVRYYGGTNLGKSGLIQVYGAAAEVCLQKATLRPIQLIWKVKVDYPYSLQNSIEQLTHQLDLQELDSSYTEKVTLVVGCPVEHKKELEDRLSQLEHLNIEAEFMEKGYI